jgi:hypothetical protein
MLAQQPLPLRKGPGGGGVAAGTRVIHVALFLMQEFNSAADAQANFAVELPGMS